MNSVSGGSASIGNAVWLTLVAAILLFFSGCFYGIGRCCIRRRGKNMWDGKSGHAEDGVRLDAVKAEADRKARQAQGETGLPAFQEYEQTPLKAKLDGDEVYLEDADTPYRDNHSVTTATAGRRPSQSPYAGGGYAPAPVGGRAIDEYNNAASYPPPPQRPGSIQTQVTASSYPSSYAPSSHTQSPAIRPMGASALAPATVSPVHEPSSSNYYNQDPYGTQAYAHATGGSSYARTDPSYYTPYDAQTQTRYAEPSHKPDPYNTDYATSYDPYGTTGTHQPERNYTLDGNGYGANTVPALQTNEPYYGNYQSPTRVVPQSTSSPPLVDTNVARASPSVSPVRGPRGPRTSIILSPPPTAYGDNPPDYEAGPPGAPGQWGRKG